MNSYELPQIPLTPTDLVNRRAAATGSVGYAKATSDANYNGHYVSVSFKPHAVSGPVWNAEYQWGERVVIGRGSLESCLTAARREYDRGARGCVVTGSTHEAARESVSDQIALFRKYGFVPRDKKPDEKPAYWTGTHEAVSDALSWERYDQFRGLVAFALKYTGSAEGWSAERTRWLDERKVRRAS